jgi:hypothetical protein
MFLPLGLCKFSPEVSPSLVDWCTALPVSAGIRDEACVQNEKERNVAIVCFRVRLHACVGVAHPILNFFENSFNGILKVDRSRYLVIILSQLCWIDETICLFQVYYDLNG